MKNDDLKKETFADAKSMLSDNYSCGVDFGNNNSKTVFIVFKGGKLVWYTRKKWKAKFYIWWKNLFSNAMILQEQK